MGNNNAEEDNVPGDQGRRRSASKPKSRRRKTPPPAKASATGRRRPATPPPAPVVASPPPSMPPSHFKTREDEKLIRLALHKSPFFTCLDEEQIERLVAAAERRVYSPGEIVVLEGTVDEDDDEEHDEEDAELYRRGRGILSMEDRRNSQVGVYEGPADDYELIDDDGNATGAGGSPAVEDDGDDGSKLKQRQRRHLTDSPSDIDGGIFGDDTADSVQEDDTPTINDPFSIREPVITEVNYKQRVTLREIDLDNEDADADDDQLTESEPPPPRSGVKRSMYIVKSGHADVWYNPGFNPASLGPGTLFGEGGFLFGRQHSASLIANKLEKLECWVVDFPTFRDHVLPSQNMSQLFHKYASLTKADGTTHYMTMEDFVRAIEQEESTASGGSMSSSSEAASLMRDPLVGLRIANTYNILSKKKSAGSNNNNNNNRISLSDFCIFHLLMARPDPEVDIAFLLMDRKQTGQIRLEDVKRFINPIFPNLDLQSQFFQRYFGKDGDLSIREHNFSQFLVDLQVEMGKQAFLRAVGERGIEGYLAPLDFVNVLKAACGWRLPKGVADRLEGMYCHGPIQAGEAAAMVSLRSGSLKGSSVEEVTRATEASVLADMEQREKKLGMRYFAYGDFVAYQEVLSILPGICNVIDRAQEIKGGPVSPDDFKVANRVLGLGGRLSRRQVDIIFSLFDLDRDGFVSHEDTVSVCGVDFAQRLVAVKGREGALTFAPPPKYRHDADRAADGGPDQIVSVTAQLKHFGLSAFAGALGVVALHPLELIKTRLMNQHIGLDGLRGRLYKNSIDCLRRVFQAEGFPGLYRGLTPCLLGAAPEKAIKLQVYSLLKEVFNPQDGEDKGTTAKINLPFEVSAGACAGACQLLVTNPMEIVKTRLILQGETSELLRKKGLTPPPPQTFQGVVKDLGLLGVYRGAAACLFRDVPFSAIYFPAYAACKSYLADQHDEASGMYNKTSLTDLLLAGTLAGVPAALCTTPLDVIRVRLQAIPRPGEPTYSGIRDCAHQIYATEGPRAFFRGAAARVLKIAPQFGITLLAYEGITQRLGFTAAHSPPTNAPVDPRDYRTAFPAESLTPKTDDIDSWMRSYGVFNNQHQQQQQSSATPRKPSSG